VIELRVVLVLLPVLLVVAAMIMRIPNRNVDVDRRGPIDRQDDRYWIGGLFYANPKDPAVFVPKRYGLGFGRTLNFGNPWSWLVFVAIAAVALLGALAKHAG